ncbi:glycosyltransferase, partial [Candidatus Sumerlaeota bacterium]|nr:glycosyltransferase [Candidatus Sumerlaeota bacterium]
MAKTRVLFLLESLARGGVQQGILLKAPRLDNAKYETQVWALRDKKKHWEMGEDFARAGISVMSVPVRHLGDSRGIIALARKLREEKIELINTRSFLPNLIGRLAATLAGVPIKIANYHHTYAHRWNAKYLACERLLRGETNAFVCVSDAVRQYLEPLLDLPSPKIKVIYNGLDTGKYQIETTKRALREKLGLPLNCPIVANIGRLTAVKDVPTFIASIPAISARIPEALFLIVGDGDERPALEAQVRQQNLHERIRFLGSREDVPEILHAADC